MSFWGYKKYQAWICELLSFWMALERQRNGNPNSKDILHAEEPPPICDIDTGTVFPTCVTPTLTSVLRLKWAPFTRRTDWQKWQGNLQQFAEMFLFWSVWSPLPGRGSTSCTWTYAFCLYLELMGSKYLPSTYDQGCSFAQACWRFRTQSFALWERCGLSLRQNAELVRHIAALPPDKVCPAGAPPGLSCDIFTQVCNLYLDHRNANPSQYCVLGVNMSDIQLPKATAISRQSELFINFRSRIHGKATVAPWISVAPTVFAVAEGTKQVNGKIIVKECGGLGQFDLEVIPSVPLPLLREAFGGRRPLRTACALLHTWRDFLQRIDAYSSGHLLSTSSFDDVWRCAFCDRDRSRSQCQAKSSTAACPGPSDSAILAAIRLRCLRLLSLAELSFHRLQFADVSVTLDDSGLPKLEAIVESLVNSVTNLTYDGVVQLCKDNCRSPSAFSKWWKAVLSRWKCLIDHWQKGKHFVLPFDVTARDGFCIACHLRCPNFSKFLINFHRRQCVPHALVSRVNEVRSVLLMLVKDLERLRGVL